MFLDKIHDVNKVRSMGQLIKFPENHPEQICMTPGLGAHTEDGRIVGKSTNMLNMCQRILHNLRPIPDSTYFVDIESLTSAGELIMVIMDKTGKMVSHRLFLK